MTNYLKEVFPLPPLNDGRVKQLKDLLDAHDWYYSSSDSNDVYERGNDEEKEILKLIREIDKDSPKLGLGIYNEEFHKRFKKN